MFCMVLPAGFGFLVLCALASMEPGFSPLALPMLWISCYT